MILIFVSLYILSCFVTSCGCCYWHLHECERTHRDFEFYLTTGAITIGAFLLAPIVWVIGLLTGVGYTLDKAVKSLRK